MEYETISTCDWKVLEQWGFRGYCQAISFLISNNSFRVSC